MSTSETRDDEPTWIDKMQGYLKWKVRGPDIHNPYAPRISSTQLTKMVSDPVHLRENIELRCTCDGYEVMLVTNLEVPRIRCDHPCLNVLTTRQIIDSIGRHALEEFIESELDKIRRDLVEEIERRKKEKKEPRESSGKTLKELKKEREEQSKMANSSRSKKDAGDDTGSPRFRSLLK